MCRDNPKNKSSIVRKSSSLLLSTKSYICEDYKHAGPPPMTSSCLTTLFIIAFLYAIEHICRFLFKDAHPLLTNDTSYKILARHVGVDFTCCAVVAYLGIKAAPICKAMWTSPSSILPSGSEVRMFTYHPEAQQVLLFFIAYQAKNLIDTIIWNDGLLYVFHHIAAGVAAYFGMYPGYAHYYGLFFMGISEISTAVLVLLANFDEKLGIDGFSEAFPSIKLGLGIGFVITFVICRVIMWPIAAYFFVRDARNVLRLSTSQVNARRSCIKATVISCTSLSVLQLVFLIEIYTVSKVEIAKMM